MGLKKGFTRPPNARVGTIDAHRCCNTRYVALISVFSLAVWVLLLPLPQGPRVLHVHQLRQEPISKQATASFAPPRRVPALTSKSDPKMNASFTSGTPSGHEIKGREVKFVSYDEHGNVTHCLFCEIANAVGKSSKLWFQDDVVSVFVPHRHPRAFYHFLVIPR